MDSVTNNERFIRNEAVPQPDENGKYPVLGKKDFKYKHHELFNHYDTPDKKATLGHECPFCYICLYKSQPVLYEDEYCFVIKDRTPGCRVHYLVNPVRHIKSIDHLKKDDSELLEHMQNVAKDLLEKENLPANTMTKVGFHKGR